MTSSGKKKQKGSVAYKNIHYIQLLARHKSNPKQVKKLLSCATDQELNGVAEVIFNILQGNIPCDAKKFKKHANFLRIVSDRKKKSSGRKRVLIKRGDGVIGTLLSIAIPALISLFGKK